MTTQRPALPPLTPQTAIVRPLSTLEYYHACIGASPHTLESAREIIFIIEGEGQPEQSVWQAALDKVCQCNPGTSLRISGRRMQARWQSDGTPPRLRMIENCVWDAQSDTGSEFIYSEPLSLVNGPVMELIIANTAIGTKTFVIVRVLHAAMDGMGVMHFYQELFRALRQQPLLGSNASFSDTDLMLSQSRHSHSVKKPVPAALTGGARGNSRGDTWQRLSLHTPQPALLARTALAVAEFTRQHSTQAVRIALPVNLRRHYPGLLSTQNFSSMIHVDVAADDNVDNFRHKITALLASNRDCNYPTWLNYLRLLPLPWLDRLVSRSEKNYRRRKILETAVLSNIGNFSSQDLSGGGFQAHRIFGIPMKDNAFFILFGMDGRVDISIGMARVYASEERLNNFLSFMQQRLSPSA